MATFYFYANVSGNWATLGNWWMAFDGSNVSVPAVALPTSSDDVFLLNAVTSNSGGAPTVASLYAFYGGWPSGLTITVTGLATLEYDPNFGTIDGDALFINGAYNAGAVLGDAEIYSNSNDGDVYGNLIMHDGPNRGTAHSDAEFYGSASNGQDFDFPGATVSGNATFNGQSYNAGIVSGNATFNGSSYNRETSNVGGDATFNGTSYNDGTINGNATFNGSSYNVYSGTINGGATFNGTSYNDAAVVGNTTFNEFSSTTGFGTCLGDSTFNDYSSHAGWLGGGVTFNHNSYMANGAIATSGVVLGVATFNNSSYNDGSVYLDAYFNDSSYSSGYADYEYYQNRTPSPIPRGINGCSLLGVV